MPIPISSLLIQMPNTKPVHFGYNCCGELLSWIFRQIRGYNPRPSIRVHNREKYEEAPSEHIEKHSWSSAPDPGIFGGMAPVSDR